MNVDWTIHAPIPVRYIQTSITTGIKNQISLIRRRHRSMYCVHRKCFIVTLCQWKGSCFMLLLYLRQKNAHLLYLSTCVPFNLFCYTIQYNFICCSSTWDRKMHRLSLSCMHVPIMAWYTTVFQCFKLSFSSILEDKKLLVWANFCLSLHALTNRSGL